MVWWQGLFLLSFFCMLDVAHLSFIQPREALLRLAETAEQDPIWTAGKDIKIPWKADAARRMFDAMFVAVWRWL